MNNTITTRDVLRHAWAWRKVAATLTAAYTTYHLLRFAAIVHRVPTWKPDEWPMG